MNLFGFALLVYYKIGRHYFLGIRLDLVVEFALLALIFVSNRFYGSPISILVGALAIIHLFLILLSKRNGYILFKPTPNAQPVTTSRNLQPDEEIQVLASGIFTVRDKNRYLVHHPTVYTSPKSREHVLMAHLKPSRFLLVGKTADLDWGWWYQFFKPESLCEIEFGLSTHGWQRLPAIRFDFRAEREDEKVEIASTILSFSDEVKRSIVWNDLTREAL